MGDLLFGERSVLFYRVSRQLSFLPSNSRSWILDCGVLYSQEDDHLTALDELCAVAREAFVEFLGLQPIALSVLPEWTDVAWPPVSKDFTKLVERLQEEATPKIGFAEVPEGIDGALAALSDTRLRQLAIRVKASEPIFLPKPDEREHFNEDLELLTTAGLAIYRALVTCRKSNDKHLAILGRHELEGLLGSCPNCRRDLKEESILDGMASTPLCNRLLDGSHWMTQYVCGALAKVGIGSEDVLINQMIRDEEIDFFVNMIGSLVVIEMKDRTFGLADARDLIDRSLRFKPEYLVAITTDTVAPEARVRLEEFKEQGRGGGQTPSIILVEGIDAIDAEFEKLANRCVFDDLSDVTREIAAQIPTNPLTLLASKLGVERIASRSPRRRSLSSAVRGY